MNPVDMFVCELIAPYLRRELNAPAAAKRIAGLVVTDEREFMVMASRRLFTDCSTPRGALFALSALLESYPKISSMLEEEARIENDAIDSAREARGEL